MFQQLEKVEFMELKTQVNLFHDHKEEDAEDFSHRFDNIRAELEYPLLTQINTAEVFNHNTVFSLL